MCIEASCLAIVGAGIGYLLGKIQGKREGEQTKLENKSYHSFPLDKGEESTPLASVVGTEIKGLNAKPLN